MSGNYHKRKVKILIGPDDDEHDVSSSNPMPVTLGGSPGSISDMNSYTTAGTFVITPPAGKVGMRILSACSAATDGQPGFSAIGGGGGAGGGSGIGISDVVIYLMDSTDVTLIVPASTAGTGVQASPTPLSITQSGVRLLTLPSAPVSTMPTASVGGAGIGINSSIGSGAQGLIEINGKQFSAYGGGSGGNSSAAGTSVLPKLGAIRSMSGVAGGTSGGGGGGAPSSYGTAGTGGAGSAAGAGSAGTAATGFGSGGGGGGAGVTGGAGGAGTGGFITFVWI